MHAYSDFLIALLLTLMVPTLIFAAAVVGAASVLLLKDMKR